MSVTSIRDEVTDTLIKECSSAVLEDGIKGFLYEVAVSIFVLRNDLRDTWDIAINDSEIKSCQ